MNICKICSLLLVIVSTQVISAVAQGLLGTQVTGTLNFNGNPLNYFDPANGYVPAGYGNSSSPTATIAIASPTFVFEDSGNVDSAQFDATEFSVFDLIGSQGAVPWTMTFTDTAFTSVSKISDNDNNGGVSSSINGDVITLTWAGASSAGRETAVFDVGVASTPVPETTNTVCFLGLSMVSLAAMKRFNQRS